METPDSCNDTPGASKHVILTPHDIPRILRVGWNHQLVMLHLVGETLQVCPFRSYRTKSTDLAKQANL